MSFLNELDRFNFTEKSNQMKFLVLSDVIKEELKQKGLKNIIVTEEPNEESMISLINKLSLQRGIIE